MRTEDFLCYETLRHEQTGTGREAFLLRIAEQFPDLSNIFFEFDPSKLAQIKEYMRILVNNALPLITKDNIGDIYRPKRMKCLKRRDIAGPNNKHLLEISAMGNLSGAISNPNAIHMHDICGGAGLLSSSIAYLRSELGSSSSASCWEIQPKLAQKHEIIRRAIGIWNPDLVFRLGDMVQTDFQSENGSDNYWMAKHPCGSNVDTIVAKRHKKNDRDAPKNTTILTCCHAKAKGSPIIRYNDPEQLLLDPQSWDMLARTANWAPQEQRGVPEFEAIGRVAMRIMDCLRVITLINTCNVRVQEALPCTCSRKNHAIIIE
jgi:hypothetical protein